MSHAATPSAPAPTPLSRWRKLTRRALLAAAGMLILLLVAFFLLPIWISNEQGRLYVLDRLNDRLHGPRVAVDSWSLGWFRTTELTNFRILAPDGKVILFCPHVSSGMTLWDIFWSNYDIRNTTADALELNLSKYANGTTSLDSFAQQEGGAGDILRSARGALQINDGKITIFSEKAGQTLNFIDAQIRVYIASPEAPFTVKIQAVGAARQRIALSGTFPPTHTLSAVDLQLPRIWTLAGDLDLAADQVPTALACDFLNLDHAWVDSFGTTLEKVSFASQAQPAAGGSSRSDAMHVALVIKGNARLKDAASLDAKMILHPPAADGTGGLLTVAADDGIRAALWQSPPLSRLLARLNPLLGEISPTPQGLVQGTVSQLTLPLDHPDKADMTLRLTFPPLLFATRDGPSLLRQLQVSFKEIPRPNERIEGTAGPLRLRLADATFSYENFLVTLGQRRLTFSGSVSLAGRLELSALIPNVDAGLGASSSQVVITGTTDTPILKRAE